MRLLFAVGSLFLSLAATAAETAPVPPPPQVNQPGPLNCGRLTWLKGCEEINKRAIANPGAPIRILDRKGVEFNFAPGTPSVMIDILLEPNEANAAKVIEWQDAQIDRASQAADIVRQVLIARGGERGETMAFGEAAEEMRAASTSSAPRRLTDAQVAAVGVYVFYDSKCKACLDMLPEVTKVIGTYPKLAVTFLQVDADARFANELVSTVGGNKVRILEGAALKKYASLLSGTPEIWVQSNKSNGTYKLKGLQTAGAIVTAIAEATK